MQWVSGYNVLPNLFPHGGPLPVKTERVSTEQTTQTPSFRDVSLGRNKDMCRNEATTKRTRNFREEKKEQRMLSDGRNEQERKK